MKIVIVGDGKVGSALTVQLAREGHDVVVIDNNKMVLQETQQSLDVSVIHGNGAIMKIQKMADVGSSDLLIAATSADETNLLCCMVARKLGCKRTIARVRDPEYYSQFYLLRDELGLNMLINPERSTATEIYRLLQFPSFLKRDSFAKGRVEIVELEIREGTVLDGIALIDLPKALKVKVLVCAVVRGGQVFISNSGGFTLKAGDRISITASSEDLAKFIRNLGIDRKKVRDVMIVGGSRIAFYLAEDLLRAGAKVTLFEVDEQRCVELANELPRATVIHADGSDKAILDAEGLSEADAVVTLTNIDEVNLIISMYANYLGVYRVITKINRTEFSDALLGKGIDCVVSPKDLCSTDILRYVRAMDNRKGETMMSLHRIVDERVEAIEFTATKDLPQIGRKLIDLRFKPNTLLACLNRNGRTIIPGGNDAIEAGDSVVVVTLSDLGINHLTDIFLED